MYVVTHEASGQTQTTELRVSGTQGLGAAVALDGSTAVVVGGEYQGPFVLADGATGWTESAYLSCDSIPLSVAISGSAAVVGQNGQASVYADGAGGWSGSGKLTPKSYEREFGNSVAVSGDNAIVGHLIWTALGTEPPMYSAMGLVAGHRKPNGEARRKASDTPWLWTALLLPLPISETARQVSSR